MLNQKQKDENSSFFANKSHEGRDISKIEDGNLGMGATDYLFFLMGHMLSTSIVQRVSTIWLLNMPISMSKK